MTLKAVKTTGVADELPEGKQLEDYSPFSDTVSPYLVRIYILQNLD